MRTSHVAVLLASVAAAFALAGALAGDPPAPAKPAVAIGCADARSVMQAYLYRDSTLEAMAAALDASDDRWQKANEAFM